MDLSSTNLRVLRQVAESGSFTAAATHLGYTQSAVSRQAAALERAAGRALFERRPDGVRLTPAGLGLLRHGRAILDALDAAERDLTGTAPQTSIVRLGLFLSAGAAVLPAVLTRLAVTDPLIQVTTREGSSPGLVRALRAGSIDLAVLASRPPFRPPGEDTPHLHIDTLADTELLLAAATTGQFAGRTSIHIDELTDAAWIGTPSTAAEPLLGVWPGLPGRPRIVHSTRDWLTKLHLVASGFGITTVPARLAPLLPPGITLLRVDGTPPELRRVLLARLPGRPTAGIRAVACAVAEAI